MTLRISGESDAEPTTNTYPHSNTYTTQWSSESIQLLADRFANNLQLKKNPSVALEGAKQGTIRSNIGKEIKQVSLGYDTN